MLFIVGLVFICYGQSCQENFVIIIRIVKRDLMNVYFVFFVLICMNVILVVRLYINQLLFVFEFDYEKCKIWVEWQIVV